MKFDDLRSLDAGADLSADIIIVGGGPAGLSIAREFFGTKTRVLVLESGRRDVDPRIDALGVMDSVGEPKTEAQVSKRSIFHSGLTETWTHKDQPFGLRVRTLGGATQAWAGKSAAFDAIDFAVRDWVPNSGWPITRADVDRYIDRAGDVLNLGPNCYDDGLWALMGVSPPEPRFDPGVLRSFFWQFARSRVDKMDVMRFGTEILTCEAPNVHVLLNATVTHIDTNADGSRVEALEVSDIDGVRHRARATAVVLAAGGVENPRIMLASNRIVPSGVGNANDVVGRYLMDHPCVTIGRFKKEHHSVINNRFGFYGVRAGGRSHMYMHGVALSERAQERERLLNCSAYIFEERAPDDPWDALKRLLRAESSNPLSDIWAVASSPGLLVKGVGMRALSSSRVPQALKDLVINTVIRLRPNFVVREFQTRGIPHKLTDLVIDAITEQQPNPESRITLSDTTDALGVPRACADWRISEQERRSVMRLGREMVAELTRVGLPAPVLEDWIADDRPQDGVFIDMGHTLGTTRMSDDPKTGVVDAACRVHGVAGLYVAGGSVFPTSGHANPTLMIIALAIRLADQLKADLRATPTSAARASSPAVEKSELETAL